jgi:hypothetical protein
MTPLCGLNTPRKLLASPPSLFRQLLRYKKSEERVKDPVEAYWPRCHISSSSLVRRAISQPQVTLPSLRRWRRALRHRGRDHVLQPGAAAPPIQPCSMRHQNRRVVQFAFEIRPPATHLLRRNQPRSIRRSPFCSLCLENSESAYTHSLSYLQPPSFCLGKSKSQKWYTM